MSLDVLAEAVRGRAAGGPALDARVKFDLGTDGFIVLDGTGPAPAVTIGDAPADVTLTMKSETLRRMVDGSLSPTMAYMTGKIKANGSLTVGMKLAALLDD